MAASTQTRIGNAVVTAVLCSPFHALLDRRTALLTITGRRSGRCFSFPVEYCRDGRVIHVMSHADHRWWRNLKGGGHLSIRIGGVDYHAFGDVIEMTEADRIRFVQSFWRDAYDRRIDADHAAELAHSAVIVRILISDD
jgi:F420H(2)-dependent quinone reductase